MFEKKHIFGITANNFQISEMVKMGPNYKHRVLEGFTIQRFATTSLIFDNMLCFTYVKYESSF